MDAQQTVRARYDYDPYGRVTKLSGDRDSAFLYAGYYWHAQSGLYLTLYRAYDPETGRWISRDPKGEAAGLNLYSYVQGDPTAFVDPYGLDIMPRNWSWDEFFHEDLVNSSAGAGDGILSVLTLGAWNGAWVRSHMPWGDSVDECSSAYKQSNIAGKAIALAVTILGPGAAARGIRVAYVEGARAIPATALAMVEEGSSLEDAAKFAYDSREALKETAREASGPIGRALIQGYNIIRGVGARTFEQLVASKGYEGVIYGAGRTDELVNFFLGVW